MSTDLQDQSAISKGVFAILSVLFFLSGFSALVYQTTWQRLLGLFSGSDSLSVTLVVGAFLLGLGVGSLVATSIADRQSHRGAILAFAFCELAIAVFAIVSKSFFYDLLFVRMVALSGSRLFVFVMAFAGLLIPTTFMGLSLPFLAKGLVRDLQTAAKSIGWLYAFNTLGAGVGAFVAGCFLIGTVGYETTIYAAALFNASIGIISLLLARRMPSLPPSEQSPAAATTQDQTRAILVKWSALVFASGFIFISLEIIWFRVVSIMLTNTAYSFALVLGCLLIGDALGIFAGVLYVDRVRNTRRAFLWLQAGSVVYALAALWGAAFILSWPPGTEFIRSAVYVFFDAFWGPQPLTVWDVSVVVGLVTSVVFPAAFLVGLSVPIAQKAIQNDLATIGRNVAIVQVANIAGNAFGSFATGLLLLHWLGTPGSLRFLGVLGIAFGVAALVEQLRAGQRGVSVYGGSIVVACLVVAVFGFPPGDRFWGRVILDNLRNPRILREDRTGLALFEYSRNGNGGTLFLGGKVQSKVPFNAGHQVIGVLGLLVHPNPKSVMIVGLGSGGTAYAAGASPAVERVKVVEILAPVYGAMQEFAARGGGLEVGRPFNDPRFERVVGDARHVLFTDPEQFDVIEQDPLSPHDSYSGLLYSREYFEQIRSRLKPGGLCVEWTPMPRIANAFRAVFPYVVQIGTHMIGSSQPIPFDRDAALQRLQSPEVRSYLEASGRKLDEIVAELHFDMVRLWTPDDPPPRDIDYDLFPKDEFYLNRTKFDLRQVY